jgi:ATP-binding cassette, subfamily C, bacterial
VSIPWTGGTRTLVRFLWRRLRPQTALALGLTVAAAATEGVGVLLLLPLLHHLGVTGSGAAGGRMERAADEMLATVGLPGTLGTVLALYVVVLATQALLTRAQTVNLRRLNSTFALHQRERLHTAVLRADWLFLTRRRTSEFTHLLSSEVDRAAYAAQVLLTLLSGVAAGAVYVAIAFNVSAGATTLTLTAGALLLIVLRRAVRASRRAGEAYSTAAGGLYRSLAEHLSALKTARSYGAEERHTASFRQVAGALSESEVASARSYADARAGFMIGSAMLLAGVVYAGSEVFGLGVASLLLLIFIFARLLPRFSGLQHQAQEILHALPAVERLEETVELLEAHAETVGGSAPSPPLAKAVRLEGVTFTYGGDREGAGVHEMELEIPAGSVTALVGPSGAGKSTVADLVLGLLRPQAGRLTVDGVPLEPPMFQSWRARIGYVSQDTHLLDGTILDNLLWARPDATERGVCDALARASADFVHSLPEGLSTPVGERGIRLSGGERQRLALARALLREPALLVLDEATSALDSASEQRIVEAVRALRGRVAVLVISHRAALAQIADHVYSMESGRVVTSGPWDDGTAVSAPLVTTPVPVEATR